MENGVGGEAGSSVLTLDSELQSSHGNSLRPTTSPLSLTGLTDSSKSCMFPAHTFPCTVPHCSLSFIARLVSEGGVNLIENNVFSQIYQ